MPAPLLTTRDLEVIARRHVAGDSDATIAADLGVERSTVRKARGRRAFKPLFDHERKLAADRAKSARYRERQRAKNAGTEPAPAERTRISRPGWNDLYLDKHGRWRREASVGVDPPATRSDFDRRGVVHLPASFVSTDGMDFGFDRDRFPLGYTPPEDRPVRMVEVRQHEMYGEFTVGHPVPAKDVPDRLKEGWRLA